MLFVVNYVIKEVVFVAAAVVFLMELFVVAEKVTVLVKVRVAVVFKVVKAVLVVVIVMVVVTRCCYNVGVGCGVGVNGVDCGGFDSFCDGCGRGSGGGGVKGGCESDGGSQCGYG